VPSYRLYCLDGTGSITSAEWLKADSDEQALQVARDLRKGVMCEVWRGEQLIGKIDSEATVEPSASAPRPQ
jgi:hypothetical protein